jgi:hypothetical protein
MRKVWPLRWGLSSHFQHDRSALRVQSNCISLYCLLLVEITKTNTGYTAKTLPPPSAARCTLPSPHACRWGLSGRTIGIELSRGPAEARCRHGMVDKEEADPSARARARGLIEQCYLGINLLQNFHARCNKLQRPLARMRGDRACFSSSAAMCRRQWVCLRDRFPALRADTAGVVGLHQVLRQS